MCRTTIWSLVDKKCTYLRGSKHPDKGLAFSPDGRTLAILEVCVGAYVFICKLLVSMVVTLRPPWLSHDHFCPAAAMFWVL